LIFPLETKTITFLLKISKSREAKAHPSPFPSDAHACIHDASEQRDAAEKIAADRLTVLQDKHADRICGRVTCYSITSFVTAGLWPKPEWSH